MFIIIIVSLLVLTTLQRHVDLWHTAYCNVVQFLHGSSINKQHCKELYGKASTVMMMVITAEEKK